MHKGKLQSMKDSKIVTLAACLIAICIALSAATVARAETSSPITCLYFSNTGHNVQGALAQFYLARNGFKNFGDPLTEAFFEDKVLVQYFRNARLDYHPENPEPFRVQVGLLGYIYNQSDSRLPSPLIPALEDPNFFYFPATGLTVGFGIKKYYANNFGYEVLGYPLTLVRNEGNNFVQYFQRGVVEWSGTDLTANTVRAKEVGQDALDRRYAKDFKWRQSAANDRCQDAAQLTTSASPTVVLIVGATQTPTVTPTIFLPTPPAPGTTLDVRVHVTLKQSPTNGTQFAEVTVDDQFSRPLKGIGLVATIRTPSGDRSFPLVATDAAGNSKFNFDIGKQSANTLIVVRVDAYWTSLTGNGSDWFMTR